MLVELARREREAGIHPEQDVDVYMKAIAIEGQEHSLVTDYIMKVPSFLIVQGVWFPAWAIAEIIVRTTGPSRFIVSTVPTVIISFVCLEFGVFVTLMPYC